MTAPAADSQPTPSLPAPDIVRRFLAWAQRTGAEDRAEAASALARAYLHSDLTPSVRAEAAVAMTALLDDPSITVRRALAEALAGAREAPRHLTLALANDQSEVAAAVLARSPLLTDAELVDCAAIGDVVAQCAIARRPKLSAGPSAALAEIGQREPAIALIDNPGAALTAGALRRLFERFGDDADVREALLQRRFLPVSLKVDIAIATVKDLSDAAAGWLGPGRAERIAREAREQALVAIAASCGSEERAELARSLRERGALTLALLLRSMLGGRRELFAATLAELTGMPHPRVTALMHKPRGEGFAALALKAGLPSHSLTALRAALCALESHRATCGEGLKLPLVESVIAACEERKDPALAKILSLLWRFAAEAARAEARGFAREATAGAPAPRLPQSLDFSPLANDEPDEPPALSVVLDLAALSAEAPLLPASLEAPSGDADPRFELLSNLVATFERAANDQGGDPPWLSFALAPARPSVAALDFVAAPKGPYGAAAPRFEPPINCLATLADEDSGATGEAPSMSLVRHFSGAAPEAPALGAALDESGDGAAPHVEASADPGAGLGRAA